MRYVSTLILRHNFVISPRSYDTLKKRVILFLSKPTTLKISWAIQCRISGRRYIINTKECGRSCSERIKFSVKSNRNYCNLHMNQRDAQILVNNPYFFVNWLYMFRTVISTTSGATFNLLKPTGHVMHQQFNIQQLYVLFCIYLRTNSDLCHLQHKLIDFFNRDEKCLLRGTNWVFK